MGLGKVKQTERMGKTILTVIHRLWQCTVMLLVQAIYLPYLTGLQRDHDIVCLFQLLLTCK